MTWFPRARRNKFGAKRAQCVLLPELAGRSFPSQAERDYAMLLVARQRAGEISGLVFQPVYRLTDAAVAYRADFEYVDERCLGKVVTVEVKGFVTERWRIIRRLWAEYGPNDMLVVHRGARGRWIEEWLMPGRPTGAWPQEDRP